MGSEDMIATALRRWRLTNDITLLEAAEKIGVKKSTIWRWETRRLRIATKHLDKLTELGVINIIRPPLKLS